MNELRPTRLSEYVGQPAIVQQLSTALKAAKQRGQALDHSLMAGPAGLGKSTLAYVIANEMGGHLAEIAAPGIESVRDIVDMLTAMRRNDVLFIDEIHRLPIEVEETLYSAMEDFKFSFKTSDRRVAGGVIHVGLPRFTPVSYTHLTLPTN